MDRAQRGDGWVAQTSSESISRCFPNIMNDTLTHALHVLCPCVSGCDCLSAACRACSHPWTLRTPRTLSTQARLLPAGVPAAGCNTAPCATETMGVVWHAGACDLGLPDSEICSGLTTPPVVMSSLQEAWSRGCEFKPVALVKLMHALLPIAA